MWIAIRQQPQRFYQWSATTLTGMLLLFISLSLIAQSNPRKPSSERQVDEDLKSLLNEYYTGKAVRAKVVIPANEHGVEVVDGQLKIFPILEMTAVVHPGDLLLIKELRFKHRSIEVHFNGEHLNENNSATPLLPPVGSFGSEATTRPAAAKIKATKTTKSLPDPRIVLKFSREIGTQDLNLQSINQLLAPAVDTTALAPNKTLTVTEPAVPQPSATELAQQSAAAYGVALAPITGELTTLKPNISEITIECAIPSARLYIDGLFSGTVPRTIQMVAGVHSFLVIAPNRSQWEQKFYLPAGKTTRITVEFTAPEK